MTQPIQSFYRFMKQYADFMDEMATAEDRKYQALISRDLERMDKTIADCQAMLMRLDKMEAQREQLQKEAGWGGFVFREIIDHLEDGPRESFMDLFERISRTVALIQHSNQKSMSYADMGLYINDMLPKDEAADTTYTASGEKQKKNDGNQAGSVFQTKI